MSQENIQSPIFVDTKQAALLLGVSENTLRKWRTRKEGPNCYRVKRDSKKTKILYKVAELEAWADKTYQPMFG